MSINLAKAIVLIAGTWLLTSQCEQVIMAVAGDNNLSSEIKRSVGRRCVAIGCGNTNKDGVSIQMLNIDLKQGFVCHIHGVPILVPSFIIANNDGLSLDDWKEWFKGYDLSQSMAIIHFTKFRY